MKSAPMLLCFRGGIPMSLSESVKQKDRPFIRRPLCWGVKEKDMIKTPFGILG